MAETIAAAQAESLSRSVQELANNSNGLLDSYIHKGSDGIISASFPVLEVPVIDLRLLHSSSAAGEQELEKLRSALHSFGCFQAINHGMTIPFLDKLREVSKLFFALPMEEKKKYARTVSDTEGYGNDSVLSETQILDWTDRLYLHVSPESQRKLQFWPENPANFRQILIGYVDKITLLNELILKAMAKSLGLEEYCFLNHYGDTERAKMIARFNFYPPSPRPDLVLGLKPHSDGSALTFLLQDKEVEGLQVLKDNQWFSVPIIPYAVLVNVGDQVEIMSNGIFRSPLHRVVTNSTMERNTLAVFCMPDPDNEIGPVEKLINENSQRLYKTVKDYTSAYFESYQLGKRPIETAKF